MVSDFGDIIAKTSYESVVWKEVLANLKVDGVLLNFIREESPSFEILRNMSENVEEADVSPYIDLPNSWDEYLASLDRHDRHELKRKIRKLESEGAFKVCHDGDPSDIDEFFRLMSLSNDQKRDFLSDKMRNFFRDIFQTFWSKKELYLCFMKLSGVNIAAALLFEFRGQLLLYNSGFDPKYARLSPGFLLKAFLIKNAIDEKKKRFDFLRGGERYKYDLGGKERKIYKILIERSL